MIKNIYHALKDNIKNRLSNKQVAVTNVRDKWFNYPANNLTPSTLASCLEEADTGYVSTAMELFQEIEKKDPQIQSCMQIRKLAIVGKEREIRPASEEKAHVENKVFIEELFDDIPNFDVFLLSLAEAIGLGFAVNEIMWDVVNGKVKVAELIEVNQINFTFYDNIKVLTTPRLLTDSNQFSGIELENKKFVYHRHIPWGRHVARSGILRTLTWFYLFKNYNLKDWSVFNEVYGMPVRVGRYKPGASPTEIEALKDALADMASDTSIAISENTVIDFLQSSSAGGKGGSNTYNTLADYCDAAIAKTVLGQTASTEGTPGKLGDEKERGRVRQDILEYDCKRIENSVNEQLIRWVIDYQFGPQEKYPKLKILCETKEDTNQRAARDEKIRRAFPSVVIPDKYVYDTYGIPEPDEKEIEKEEERKKLELEKKEGSKVLPFKELKGKEIIEVATEEIDTEIASLKKTIANLSQNLTKKEMASIMGRIGNKITAFEGELKEKVIRKVQRELKPLLQGTKKQQEVLKNFTTFFNKPEFVEEGLRQMEPASRARLYMRNELKNVYTDTYHETVKKAFPDEELYAYSSGPRDARTADDSISVEEHTNPDYGGMPLKYPEEWEADPIVQASLRPNDRGQPPIIQPLFMFSPDVQKRIKS